MKMVKPTGRLLGAAGMLVSGIVPLSSYASADMRPSRSPKRVKAEAVEADPEQAWENCMGKKGSKSLRAAGHFRVDQRTARLRWVRRKRAEWDLAEARPAGT